MNINFSTPAARYRSVKYRVGHSNSLLESQPQKKFYLKGSSAPKKSMPRIGTSLNKIKNIFEPNQISQFQVSNYIQTFDHLINSQKKSRQKRQQWKNQYRVLLPNIIETQQCSKFTTLDPISKPIIYIQSQIIKLNDQLLRDSEKMKQIKRQIQIYQTNGLRNIDRIQVQIIQGFNRLQKLLKTNRVIQQQITMKAKRSLQQLKTFIPIHQQQFEDTHKRTKYLQQVIFETHPFELHQKQQFQTAATTFF